MTLTDLEAAYKANPSNLEKKFEYAVALIGSPGRKHIILGLDLLDQLMLDGQDKADYLFFLALAHFRLHEYDEANRCLTRLLRIMPHHNEAKVLHEIVNDRAKRDGVIGMVTSTVIACLGAYVAFKLLKGGRGGRSRSFM